MVTAITDSVIAINHATAITCLAMMTLHTALVINHVAAISNGAEILITYTYSDDNYKYVQQQQCQV